MQYEKEIKKLSNIIKQFGLLKEGQDILNVIEQNQDTNINDWYELLQEIDHEEDSILLQLTRNYLIAGAQYLEQATLHLQGVKPEDIKPITDTIPFEELIKEAQKKENLIKFASTNKQNDAFIKSAEFCVAKGWIERPNYKKAGWWSYVKSFTGTTLKYIVPFVSLIFAMINFYYCYTEFTKLLSNISSLNLFWYDALIPQNLLKASDEYREEPNNLKELVKATKNSKEFLSNFISLITNSIDGIKDMIFFLGDIATGGWAIAIDLGISFLLMLIEYALKHKTLPYYDNVLSEIRNIAVEKIKLFEFARFKEKFKESENDALLLQELEKLDLSSSI